jgi:hypothetical protein
MARISRLDNDDLATEVAQARPECGLNLVAELRQLLAVGLLNSGFRCAARRSPRPTAAWCALSRGCAGTAHRKGSPFQFDRTRSDSMMANYGPVGWPRCLRRGDGTACIRRSVEFAHTKGDSAGYVLDLVAERVAIRKWQFA